MTLPRETTIATVESELTGIRAYAERHSWSVTWEQSELRLVASGQFHTSGEDIRIIGQLDGYRALPPAWTFEAGPPETPQGFFPQGRQVAPNVGSIFHSNRVICAPFNRLAYTEHGGPHSNWCGPGNWLNVVQAGHIRETTLAGMLASIITHLAASPGKMS